MARRVCELERREAEQGDHEYAADVLRSHLRALAAFLCACRVGEDGSADDFLDPAAHVQGCPYRVGSELQEATGEVADDNFALAHG
jgi:hypothetical protein